jgi:hypothetical protein
VAITVAYCGICGSDLHEYIDGPHAVQVGSPGGLLILAGSSTWTVPAPSLNNATLPACRTTWPGWGAG